MKILIVEDDDIYARALEMMIIEMGYESAGVANNANQALRLFKATNPSLVLMDVNLRDGINGIELAQQIQPVSVIFLTAMQEERVFEQAVVVNPVAYLNKPVDRLALQRSIKLAIHKNKHSHTDGLSLHIKTGKQLHKLSIDTISYVRVEQKQVTVVLPDRQVNVRMSLSKISELLPDQYFIQVHQSYIINIKKTERIGDDFVQIGAELLPVSRRHRKKLWDCFNTV